MSSGAETAPSSSSERSETMSMEIRGITKAFGISHVTLQIERAQRDDCEDC